MNYICSPILKRLMGRLELVIETDNVSIFSPKFNGEEMTEFEKFLLNNGNYEEPQLKKDFDAILSAINKIQNDCGARENLFRLEGGCIKAIPLFIEWPRKRSLGTIRLYCIRISERLLILGNGGIKKTKTYEKDPFLGTIVNDLRRIESIIRNKSRIVHCDYDDYEEIKHILSTINI